MAKFPFFKQFDSADCGPTCLRMVSAYYGKPYSLYELRKKCYITKDGVSLLSISDAAEELGFTVLRLELTIERLEEELILPCILHWRKDHFVVLYGVVRNASGEIIKYKIADPANGRITLGKADFLSNWQFNKERNTGIVLFLEPTASFYENKEPVSEPDDSNRVTWRFIFSYFLRYRKYFFQLVIGMLTASLLSLIFPFLTQSIVDIGIANGDLHFIVLILFAQLFIFVGTTVIELIQSQLFLHISTRINLAIISDFLAKLMNLPISFFDSKNTGDISNRINDQKRIEVFITSAVLRTIFSTLNFIIYAFVIATYSIPILLIFLAGSFISVGWTFLFMKKRRDYDYTLFRSVSASNENVLELIGGMQEIKLNQLEEIKQKQWLNRQVDLFRISISTLRLEQYQSAGSVFITQLKNIFITFLAASAVVNGDITLGVMLSISFIIGQLNAPIEQFISTFKLYQNAKISIERMKEVYQEKDEESAATKTGSASIPGDFPVENNHLFKEGIFFDHVSYSYAGPRGNLILKDVSFQIPLGKITAIVGASGSGKTTIMKLLLKFYEPGNGSIYFNGHNLIDVSASWWRSQCGSVMQEGFIFSDTIRNNIVAGWPYEKGRLDEVCETACLKSFIKGLPLGLETKIGSSGIGLSGGEKQRILIARAIYKDPAFLFFDEAISALDANTEKQITENLNSIYKGRTVVIIAHRLSTVRNADHILVVQGGEVAEAGSHKDLVEDKGIYYSLIRNQLELG